MRKKAKKKDFRAAKATIRQDMESRLREMMDAPRPTLQQAIHARLMSESSMPPLTSPFILAARAQEMAMQQHETNAGGQRIDALIERTLASLEVPDSILEDQDLMILIDIRDRLAHG